MDKILISLILAMSKDERNLFLETLKAMDPDGFRSFDGFLRDKGFVLDLNSIELDQAIRTLGCDGPDLLSLVETKERVL